MSYVSAFAIFILVLSPVFIPLIITGVHSVAKLRRGVGPDRNIAGPLSRAVTSD